MSFTCQFCQKTVKGGVPAKQLVVASRERVYHVKDAEGEYQPVVGRETVKEIKVCPEVDLNETGQLTCAHDGECPFEQKRWS